MAKALGIPDGYRFHGEIVHYPALVLYAPGGEEIFRYVGQNNSDRVSFDKLKSLIAKHRENASPATKPATRPAE